MNTETLAVFEAYVVLKSGVSSKTNKPYAFKVLQIDTERFGVVEIPLNTRTDKGAIVLDMITQRKE